MQEHGIWLKLRPETAICRDRRMVLPTRTNSSTLARRKRSIGIRAAKALEGNMFCLAPGSHGIRTCAGSPHPLSEGMD